MTLFYQSKFNLKEYWFLKLIALFMLSVFIVSLFQSIKDREVINNGMIVQATIVSIPDECNFKNTLVYFEYKNIKFTKSVNRLLYNDLKNEKVVNFYYMEKYPSVFVFEIHKDLKVDLEFYATILLILFFSYALYYFFYKI